MSATETFALGIAIGWLAGILFCMALSFVYELRGAAPSPGKPWSPPPSAVNDILRQSMLGRVERNNPNQTNG